MFTIENDAKVSHSKSLLVLQLGGREGGFHCSTKSIPLSTRTSQNGVTHEPLLNPPLVDNDPSHAVILLQSGYSVFLDI